MHCSESIIAKNVQITSDIFVIDVENPGLKINPGQFFMIKGWGGEPTLMRPISVFKADVRILSFMYRVVGKGTRLLSLMQEGDKLTVLGPCGNGYPVDEISGNVALVGGGVGIPPLCHTAKVLSGKGCRVDACLGYRNEVFAASDFEPYCNTVAISTEDGSSGYKGFVTDILQPENYDFILTCGPEVMMRSVVAKAAGSGAKVFCSLEHRMACGIGACLGCSIRTKKGMRRVCKEGPVFDSALLDW